MVLHCKKKTSFKKKFRVAKIYHWQHQTPLKYKSDFLQIRLDFIFSPDFNLFSFGGSIEVNVNNG